MIISTDKNPQYIDEVKNNPQYIVDFVHNLIIYIICVDIYINLLILFFEKYYKII